MSQAIRNWFSSPCLRSCSFFSPRWIVTLLSFSTTFSMVLRLNPSTPTSRSPMNQTGRLCHYSFKRISQFKQFWCWVAHSHRTSSYRAISKTPVYMLIDGVSFSLKGQVWGVSSIMSTMLNHGFSLLLHERSNPTDVLCYFHHVFPHCVFLRPPSASWIMGFLFISIKAQAWEISSITSALFLSSSLLDSSHKF